MYKRYDVLPGGYGLTPLLFLNNGRMAWILDIVDDKMSCMEEEGKD